MREENMTPTPSFPIIEAVRRRLEIEEGEAGVLTVITLSTHFSVAPARLWPHLTDAEHLRIWYGEVLGDLAEGAPFRVGSMRGTVLELEEPHKLSLTLERGDTSDALLVQLDPEDDGTTELRLRHTAQIPRDVFDQFGSGYLAIDWEIALLSLAAATGGWAGCGATKVPAPTDAWLASPEGADHLRAWSIRWAAEAVAAGLDETLARETEAETTRAGTSPHRGRPQVIDAAAGSAP